MALTFLKLTPNEARTHIRGLAELRLKVFHDFPYLYEGNMDYEEKYLETYFKAKHAIIFIVMDGERYVGATTGIWAKEEEENFSKPFINQGFNINDIFYFGESILLKEYRGQGIGKKFFEIREAYAKKLGFIKKLAFCAVVRDENHPLKPQDYLPLNTFWPSQGFNPEKNLTTTYEWKDIGQEQSSFKQMQFWIKNI